MALNADDEILQDFLVEAGEILEQLNEQLVELEQTPDDADLLNAVFRGFHTIKGGAGFLNLTALVDVCHRAEDVFNLLRNGERQVDAHLIDVILPVLDVLNSQFDSLRAGEEPEAAPQEMLLALEGLAKPGAGEAEPAGLDEAPEPTSEGEAGAEPVPEQVPSALFAEAPAEGEVEEVSGDITDEEFEALLDALDGQEQGAAESAGTKAEEPQGGAPAADDEITEDEFEALLDQIHGKGKHGGVPKGTPPAGGSDASASEGEPSKPPAKPTPPAVPSTPAKKSEPAAPKKKPESHAPQTETTVRVDTKRLDDIMNMVGELVLVRNRLATLSNAEENTHSLAREEMGKAIANLDVVTGDLQAAVMKTRMQPIKKVFGRFPRVVRDLARNLKKEVNLVMQGEETDLDKNLVEALADPLVHLVRNAVDHGIEMPDDREAKGKPRAGSLRLAAEQEGDHILLLIEDDGAGMDADVLRRKAVEKGILDEEAAARMDDRECFNLIFAPGFSTKSDISDISGRGVGMDVVKTRIAQLNGSVEIDSELGKGTLLSIKVPLTLAIMPTLMIKLERQTFALPLVSVSEIFNLDLTNTNVVDGQLVVMVRERALPLFYLSRWLVHDARGRPLPESGHVVVVHIGTQQVGFVVDQLIGQEEVVIKPLGAMLHGTQGMAGATITGDGKIALILDVPGLMRAYAQRYS